MKALLLKHKPKGVEQDKWKEQWEAGGYLLQPLADVLLEMKQGVSGVSKSDFDCPNHYAKLAWQAGQEQIIDDILALFPSSIELFKK